MSYDMSFFFLPGSYLMTSVVPGCPVAAFEGACDAQMRLRRGVSKGSVADFRLRIDSFFVLPGSYLF